MALAISYSFISVDSGVLRYFADDLALTSHIDGYAFLTESGAAMYGEMYVHVPITVNGSNPALAGLTNHNLVAAFQDADSINYTVFDETGAVMITRDIGDAASTNADVARLAGGGFVIANEDFQSGTDYDIDLRFFNSAGTEVRVVTADITLATDRDVQVVQLANGNVAATWTRTTGSTNSVWYAVYNAVGDVVKAPAATPNGIVNPDIVATPTGFAIVTTGLAGSIRISDYDMSGTNTGVLTLGGTGSDPSATVTDNGYLVVVTDNGANGLAQIFSTGERTLLGEYVITGPSFANPTVIDIDDGANQVVFGFGSGVDTRYQVANLARVVQGDAADDIYGSPDPDMAIIFHGGAGLDAVTTNAANDFLFGEDGADYMNAEAGRDSLVGGDGKDNLHGGGGDDSIYAGDAGGPGSWTGGDYLYGEAGADYLEGGLGADILDGGTQADVMFGGMGDDSYYVDNVGDAIIEKAGLGANDRIFSSVTVNAGTTDTTGIEGITLTGSAAINALGNAQANTIVGNTGNNGLNGGAGADTLHGGLGNDVYTVDNLGDVVFEGANGGVDVVRSSVTFNAATAAAVGVENIALTGDAAINALGNALANTIIGNSANNGLNGGAGADRLKGGLGNDVYTVDNAGDVVEELAGEGTDLVNSTVSFNAASATATGIENVTLTGSAAVNVIGNALTNTLIGNSAVNVVSGGGGSDNLTGGGGADIFDFNSAAESSYAAYDRITDLTNADRIDLAGIDANANLAGNQAFVLVDALTGAAGQITLTYNASAQFTVLAADLTGDGVADMRIVLNGNHEDFTNFGL